MFHRGLSGAAVAQEEEQSSANQKVSGLAPGFLGAHVKAPVGKTQHPTLPLDAFIGL